VFRVLSLNAYFLPIVCPSRNVVKERNGSDSGASNFSASAAYVGTLSHDLPFAQDINAPATGTLAPTCTAPGPTMATSNSGNIVQRRLIDNPDAAR
jgi:hypothetical protein